MESNIISFNIVNIITVFLMVAIGYAIITSIFVLAKQSGFMGVTSNMTSQMMGNTTQPGTQVQASAS